MTEINGFKKGTVQSYFMLGLEHGEILQLLNTAHDK